MEHPDDHFEVWEWIMDFIDYPAQQFINERICGVIAERENVDWDIGQVPSFDLKSWNDEIDSFAWDRILTPDEAVKIKENIVLTNRFLRVGYVSRRPDTANKLSCVSVDRKIWHP